MLAVPRREGSEVSVPITSITVVLHVWLVEMSHLFLKQRLGDPRFQSGRVDVTTTAVTPWYAARGAALSSVPVSVMKKRSTFAKRKKYYSSDSSASERETEGHKEGVIRRMPKGSSKEYYVYHAGKKITFGGDFENTQLHFEMQH